MKKISLATLLVCLSAFYCFAQKPKVQTAWNYYKPPYQEYDKAKQAIDEAAVHEQTAGMAKTWYYRGLIYFALYKSEKYGQLCDNCLVTAYESFQKSLQIEPNNEWKDEINLAHIPNIVSKLFQEGSKAFEQTDYKTSLDRFSLAEQIYPNDTIAILYTAYSAERAGDTARAIKNYSKLVGMKFNDDNIYLSLANLYGEKNDTTNAMKTIQEGRKLYPDSIDLINGEINLFLKAGRSEEATNGLNVAISKDPSNALYYLALGSAYENLANPKDKNHKELPKSARYAEYMSKAEESYKRGIAVKPDDYQLNYNLGAMYFNQAAEMVNQANDLKSDEEFRKAEVKFKQKFLDAQPYLEKAMATNPKIADEDKAVQESTLVSLKQLYLKTGQTEKFEQLKSK
jgi:tetratricopeptide (TPR) repeat protein